MKDKTLNIAVYSGVIPSSVFIENLISGISDKYCIQLFGKRNHDYKAYKKRRKEEKKCILFYSISDHRTINFIVALYRFLLLWIKFPKRGIQLLTELKKHKGIKSKYIWTVRYLPVLLNIPDIFHIQWAKELKYWFFLKEKFNVKIIVSLRGAHINYSPLVDLDLAQSYRLLFPKVDAFHAVSKAIGDNAKLYGADTNKIHVIHSPISEKVLESFSIKIKKSGTKLNIISIGRFHWKKGFQDALLAISDLIKKNFNISYTIIATNKPSENFLYMRHILGLDAVVKVKPSLPHDILLKELKDYDILLLPSYEEGIANVVLESMSVGLPVISSDCGGMNEVVNDGVNGFVFRTGNVEDLSKKIEQISKMTEGELQTIVEKAHQTISKDFNSKDVNELFINLYKSVL